jgi:hypothetical protein
MQDRILKKSFIRLLYHCLHHWHSTLTGFEFLSGLNGFYFLFAFCNLID